MMNRRSFLNSLSVVSISTFLGCKEQSKLKYEINWKCIKKDPPNLEILYERYMLSIPVIIRYGIKKEFVKVGHVWDDGGVSNCWDEGTRTYWTIPHVHSWAYKSDIMKVSELTLDQKNRFLSYGRRDNPIYYLEIINGVLIPDYCIRPRLTKEQKEKIKKALEAEFRGEVPYGKHNESKRNL